MTNRTDPAFPISGGLINDREKGISTLTYVATQAMIAIVQREGVPTTEKARAEFGARAVDCANMLIDALEK